MFADNFRIIPYPEVAVADVENTLMHKTQTHVKRAHAQCVDVIVIRRGR
jgi:hypothetical protein